MIGKYDEIADSRCTAQILSLGIVNETAISPIPRNRYLHVSDCKEDKPRGTSYETDRYHDKRREDKRPDARLSEHKDR